MNAPVLLDARWPLLPRQFLQAPAGKRALQLILLLARDPSELGTGAVQLRGIADHAAPARVVPGHADREVTKREFWQVDR